MKNNKLLFEFLNSVNHAVISTVNEKGYPQSATVGFGQTKELELIFGTDKNTRKAKNISKNSNVSFVINGPEISVQYEGAVSLLTGEELTKFQKLFFKKMPSMEKYSLLPSQVYYKAKPTWIRCTDHATAPGKVFEIVFDA